MGEGVSVRGFPIQGISCQYVYVQVVRILLECILVVVYGDLTIIVLSAYLDELDQLDKDFRKTRLAYYMKIIAGNLRGVTGVA